MCGKYVKKYEGIKVLLVEDDRGIRRTLVDFLERNGCSVFSCLDAYCARQRIVNGCDYDVLFTDIAMDGKAGGDHVIDASRNFYPERPVVVISESRAYSTNKPVLGKYKEGFLTSIPNADKQIKKVKLGNKKTVRGQDILNCLRDLFKDR